VQQATQYGPSIQQPRHERAEIQDQM
jgi:hypothetical protein